MDPSPLSAVEWTQINELVTSLWIMVALVVFMATNALVGAIFIPSLIASKQLPPISEKTRPIFYALSLLSFIVVVIFAVKALGQASVIGKIYETYWIYGGMN